mgnify:CR=1 FL=1
MAQSKILVTASTGNIGLPLSKALQRRGIHFTAATRDADRAKKEFGFDTDTVHLDFKDPSGFGPALEGKELLFLCGPSATPGAQELLKPLVEEAIAGDVKHVVFVASYPGLMELIEKSDMNFTFLKANFFMQNFEMYQAEDIRERDQIFLPTGAGKAPFIHTRDIGEAAAVVMENPGAYEGETIYLTGPESMDHFRAADIFSDVLGRKISYQDPDDDEYRKEMEARGYSEEYIEAMIAVFGKIKKGQVASYSDGFENITGRKPATLKEYVEENREEFV